MNEMLEGYIEDLKDSLINLNKALMEINAGSVNKDIINSIFRVAHTIKGNSAAMEFERIEKVMHTMEDILHEVRSGTREFSKSILNALYACHDFLEDCQDVVEKTNSDSSINIDKMLVLFSSIANDDGVKAEQVIKSHETQPDMPCSSFEGIPVDVDTWEVIAENSKRGMTPYIVDVDIDKDSVMKSIVAWLVFDAALNHAMLLYSDPVQPDEEAFRNGSFTFEGTAIQLVVLVDKDIGELTESIMQCTDVIVVREHCITPEEIALTFKKLEKREAVFNVVKEIGMHLVDSSLSPLLSSSSINTTLGLYEKMFNLDLTEDNPFIHSACIKIIEILKVRIETNQTLDMTHIEILAKILQLIEDGINRHSCRETKGIMDSITESLSELEALQREPPKRIGDILQSKGILNEKDVDEILEKQKQQKDGLKFGQIAVKENKASAYEIVGALKEQSFSPEKKDAQSAKQENAFIRVPVTKVDSLMDMLSELLIFNSQIEQEFEAASTNKAGIVNVLSRTAKLIKGIQSLSMSLRMIEIRPTLHRLTRIVRDTAAELNKKVTVVLEGEDTEIDRSATDKLFDPLMHLVRNSVSHGIEPEEQRRAAGKNPEGKVTIRAYNKRGSVYIEVSDDGRGMDAQKILQKAIALKMADENREYSEDEIIRFIFKPGFSTQEQINNISGRGVGTNVVEEEITRMGGKVDVINEPGKGCTFVLRIPLNLAVVNGTIVEVAGGKYIIPTLFIKEFYIAQECDWISIKGKRRAIRIRDNVIPIISASQIFLNTDDPELQNKRELIILEVEQKLLAFPVDRIVSRQEIVSKPLGSEFSGIGYASGASILGDGTVSLILDVESMFKLSDL